MKKIILHLCADIGSDSWFYANDDGYEVIKVGKDIGVENFNPPENVYGVIANPVCTEFSFAKWANNKGDGDVEEGMFLVNHCLRIIKQCSPKFWVIENPATGRLKEFLGAPRLVYQPYEYGSPWTKNTALWGEFNVPEKTHTWETVEKTYYDLTVPREIGFDFATGSRISVVGSFKTKKWEKGVNLVVRASSVEAFASFAQEPEELLPF